MTFDKDTLRSFNNYLSKTAILIIPGMVIVEFVFHVGLLSGNVNDFPELIQLIVWSFVFSVPYYGSATLTMLWLSTPLAKLEKAGATGEDLLEKGDDFYEECLFLTIPLVLITFILYKAPLSLNWLPSATYLGIKREYVLCITSIVITMLLSAPLAVVYYWALDKVVDSIIRHKRSRNR